MGVLRLKLPTGSKMGKYCRKESRKLTDHAWCEQKAATNAITIITNNSEHQIWFKDLLALAKEEIDHFEYIILSSKEELKLDRTQRRLRIVSVHEENGYGSRVSV
jgi:tRNA-(ms[2]io[6]A)-hydroxylase